jgi:thioredoxin-dependent peroxiredoxin
MEAYRDQYATLFHNGDKVTLLAISLDPVDALASWARDEKFPFTFLSDSGGVVGRQYGAFVDKYQLDGRAVFVVAPGGKVSYVASPFREIDPQAYTDLGGAIGGAGGK